MSRLRLTACAAVLGLIAATWWAYSAGLSGPFLFDDFGSLPNLGDWGAVDNVDTFLRYVTAGSEDPTGRPLGKLALLIDARNWPAPPEPFKRTNVILHLLNGLLLIGLLYRLGRALRTDATQASWSALVGGGIWLLHPYLVSTTLYIVQRDTMLVGTCVLIGLHLWLSGRSRLLSGQRLSGGLVLTLGAAGGTLLAMAAKANGALLPLYLLLLERVLLASPRGVEQCDTLLFRRLRWPLIYLPSLALLAYLASHLQNLNHTIESRGWSLGQRLLTEPGILLDYLWHLFLPRPLTGGIYQDQLIAAQGLFDPPQTVLAIALVAALIGGAVALRRRTPVLAFAVLFFFVGHLLESSVIPLELKFEHRNYVPAMFLLWPVALWLTRPGHRIKWRAATAVGLLVLLAFLTHMRAEVWGGEIGLYRTWARIQPDSPRAQTTLALVEMGKGRYRDAARHLETLLPEHADEVQVALNLLAADCHLGQLRSADIDRAANALASDARLGQLTFNWLSNLAGPGGKKFCPGLAVGDLRQLLNAAYANPVAWAHGGTRSDLANIEGRLALTENNPEAALQAFDRGLENRPAPDLALSQAAYLASHGHPELGLRHLDYFEQLEQKGYSTSFGWGMPRLHAWLLERQGYWENEITILRDKMRRAAEGQDPTRGADG